MATNEKNIGSSPISGNPDKRLVFKLKDGSVTSPKIGDGSITLEKLSEEVMNTIMRYKKDGITVNIYEEGSTSGGGVQSVSVNWGEIAEPDINGNVNLIIPRDSGIMILSDLFGEDDVMDNPTANMIGMYAYKEYHIYKAIETTSSETPYIWQDITGTLDSWTVFYSNEDGKFYACHEGILRELNLYPSTFSQFNKGLTEVRQIANNKGTIYNVKKLTATPNPSQIRATWAAPEEVNENIIASLYVDVNTNLLYLEVIDSTYGAIDTTITYFQNWSAYGDIPSSDTLADSNVLFWYVTGGTLYVCHYNKTTHKLVQTAAPGGGSSEGDTIIIEGDKSYKVNLGAGLAYENNTYSSSIVSGNVYSLNYDATNNILSLSVVSSGNVKYYRSWVVLSDTNMGNIPSSDTFKNGDVTIYYVKNNTLFIGKYVTIDDEAKWYFTGTGASSDSGDEGEDTPIDPHTYGEVDADGNPFTEFDYTKGNPGIFKFNKAPENITVNDIENAYEVLLPPSFVAKGYKRIKDVPIIQAGTDGEGLWTAAKIGLQYCDKNAANLTTVKDFNRGKVIAALKNEKCLGFYLDKVYQISPLNSHFSSFSSSSLPNKYVDNEIVGQYSSVSEFRTRGGDYKHVASSTSSPVYNQYCDINIPRDFIISGAGASVGKGGFGCRYNLFYTEHSLVLYNMKLELTQEDTYPTFYINLENGIDQLQVVNCEFTSDGYNDHIPVTTYHDKGTRGHYIMVYSPNTRPYKLKEGEQSGYADTDHRTYNGEVLTIREVEDYNYINHIYVKNSSFMGSVITLYGGTRVVKTARFINNIVTDITSPAIYWGCPNLEENAVWDMCALSYGKNIEDRAVKTYLADKDGKVVSANNYMCTTRLLMSCPMYVAGNSFSGPVDSNGNPIIITNQKSGSTYICAVLEENSASYFLHNEVKNIVTAVYSYRYPQKNYYKNSSDEYINDENAISRAKKDGIYYKTYSEEYVDTDDNNAVKTRYYYITYPVQRNGMETYDTYESCHRVYNCNNKVTDVIKFVKGNNGDNNSGICKSKNANYGAVKGGLNSDEMCRYYNGNEYKLNKSLVKSVWDNYVLTINDESDVVEHLEGNSNPSSTSSGYRNLHTNFVYINSLNTEVNDVNGKVLSIHFAESVMQGKGSNSVAMHDIYPTRSTSKYYHHYVFKEWVFSNNTVDAGDGSIWGMKANNMIPTAKFECNKNTFKASRFSNTIWDESNAPYDYSTSYSPVYLFAVRLAKIPKYGNSVLYVKDNEFICTSEDEELDNNARLRFVVNNYYLTEETRNYGTFSLTSNCVAAPGGDISEINNNIYTGNKSGIIAIDKRKEENSSFAITKIKEFPFGPIPDDEQPTPTVDYGDVGRALPVEEPQNPADGDMFIIKVGTAYKVMRYLDNQTSSILVFRCYPTNFTGGNFDLSNFSLPFPVSTPIGGLESMDIVTYLGSFYATAQNLYDLEDKTQYNALLNLYEIESPEELITSFIGLFNPEMTEGTEGYSKQEAYNAVISSDSASGMIQAFAGYLINYNDLTCYIRSVADLVTMFKMVLLIKGYTYKGHKYNDSAHKANYVTQSDFECFDVYSSGSSWFVRIAPDSAGDDYTALRSWIYQNSSINTSSEFSEVIRNAYYFPYPTSKKEGTNQAGKSFSGYNSVIGSSVTGWIETNLAPGATNIRNYDDVHPETSTEPMS